jgi:hypothetical protein
MSESTSATAIAFRPWGISYVGVALGAAAILTALTIGALSYRQAFALAERRYHAFYSDELRLLVEAAKMNAHGLWKC